MEHTLGGGGGCIYLVDKLGPIKRKLSVTRSNDLPMDKFKAYLFIGSSP